MIGVAKLAAGSGCVALAERPERPPGPGEVSIAVKLAGVCGTDLHIEAGEYAVVPPVTMGHEVAGVVAAVGEGVSESWLGTAVVTETYYSTCGKCIYCREGRPNLCPERRSIGTHVDGGFAPQLIVPAHNLHRVPDRIDLRAAVLAEPLACVCQSLLDPGVVSPGDRVLVVGVGPMGVLAAQVARMAGGRPIVMGLPSDLTRLEMTRGFGIDVTTSEEEAPSDVDVVIEASGSEGGLRTALAATRRGGAFVQTGIFGREVTVALNDLLLKEVEVRTGFASTPRAWRRALAMIASRQLELEAMVDMSAPLEDFERVFAELRAARAMKAVLVPGADAR